MKKGYIKVIAAIATLCLALFGFAACTKAPAVGVGGGGDDNTDPDYGDGSKLASVVASSIVPTESITPKGIYIVTLEWAAADKASRYKVKCNGVQLDDVFTSSASVSQNVFGNKMPTDRKFNFEIVSAGPGYVDSDATTYSYSAEGVQLNSLEITSFENGILKWKAVPGASGYTVAIGERGGTLTDKVVTDTQLNVNADTTLSGKPLTLEIGTAGDGVYKKTSDPVRVNVNTAHTKLTMSPVTDYTVTDGVLSWQAVGGAKGYLVVDIEYNKRVITSTEYDVSDKIPVYGVYPVSASTLIADAEIERVAIPYIAEGDGTSNNAYNITTPFELRMIDYYEMLYAEDLRTQPSLAPLCYKLANDLDYNSVSVPEGVSNIYPIAKPFYGKFNGNNKTLKNICVRYASGYWALFDYVAKGAEIKKLTIDAADIENELANLTKPTYPVGATIAAIAYENYGTISNITLTGAKFTATGGEVCGVATYNCAGGIVENCTVGGGSVFKQNATGQKGQACYEMAGVVLENLGTVRGNNIADLTIEGSVAMGDGPYNCVRCAGGIVSVNRAGGVVANNSYTKLTMKTVNEYTVEHEFGGIVAYNAGTVTKGSGNLGTFTFNGLPKSAEQGSVTWVWDSKQNKDVPQGEWVGKLVGKNQGTATE